MSDKVLSLQNLETCLGEFTNESLKSKDARFELLKQLKESLIFIRDYDKPPPNVLRRAEDYMRFYTTGPCDLYNLPEYARYSPTIDPLLNFSYLFRDERS